MAHSRKHNRMKYISIKKDNKIVLYLND